MSEWISVDDRLPVKNMPVLVFLTVEMGLINKGLALFDNGMFRHCRYFHHKLNHTFITHWMPLPEPPKENNND